MTDGINIPREVAEAEGVPEDLDAGSVGPHRFASPRRRAVAGAIYLVAAALMLVMLRLAPAMGWMALGMGLLGVYHLVTAWPLRIEQEEALTEAARRVSFPVGHASAAVMFRGWRARPTWHVLLYSADDPPGRRGLVRLDALTGELVDPPYEEDVAPPPVAASEGATTQRPSTPRRQGRGRQRRPMGR